MSSGPSFRTLFNARFTGQKYISSRQSESASQKGGAVRQPAWHGGAVDQGRQERRQMDAAVLSRFCGQPGAAATVRAGLQLGQLSATGGAAASGASLDVDDAAGKTDQDWGEGRAPFPEDRLPDGGSGGSASVVPDHFGTDWAAEIGNRDVRMKADHVKTTATTGEVSSHPGDKGIGAKNGVETPPAPGKNRWRTGKMICKSVEQHENHEKVPRRSWSRNQMGNPGLLRILKNPSQYE
jgi:hypothetical protein